ncbi:MAG: hypothetical protein MJ252_03035 [archaeon]|nr:hypothetical protein [archaeon]
MELNVNNEIINAGDDTNTKREQEESKVPGFMDTNKQYDNIFGYGNKNRNFINFPSIPSNDNYYNPKKEKFDYEFNPKEGQNDFYSKGNSNQIENSWAFNNDYLRNENLFSENQNRNFPLNQPLNKNFLKGFGLNEEEGNISEINKLKTNYPNQRNFSLKSEYQINDLSNNNFNTSSNDDLLGADKPYSLKYTQNQMENKFPMNYQGNKIWESNPKKIFKEDLNPQFNQNQKEKSSFEMNQNTPRKKENLSNTPLNSMSLPMNQTQGNYYSYNDIQMAANAVNLIKEQNGCRYIQEKINYSPSYANDVVFPYLVKSGQIINLVSDQFGNYFFQALLLILSPENFEIFLMILTKDIFKVSISPYGTRVLQVVLEIVSKNENHQQILMNAFMKVNLIIIIEDPYGNHIIQKYLQIITDEKKKNFIFETIENNFLEITNSKYGVCVVQKCLISNNKNTHKDQIIHLLIQNINLVFYDQFGSYAIQFVLTSGKVDLSPFGPLFEYIKTNIEKICVQRYSANVIEKCFESENDAIKNVIASYLVQNKHCLVDLLLDKFGNYVIQKCLLKVKGELYFKMLEIIYGGIDTIKRAPYGHNLLTKLMNKHQEFKDMVYRGYQNEGQIPLNNPSYNIINNQDSLYYSTAQSISQSKTNPFPGISYSEFINKNQIPSSQKYLSQKGNTGISSNDPSTEYPMGNYYQNNKYINRQMFPYDYSQKDNGNQRNTYKKNNLTKRGYK